MFILDKYDNFKNMGYGYYCESSSLRNIKSRLSSKSYMNCSDKALQYKDMDESIKEGFVVACMKIVLEDWSNKDSLIKLQNDLYGFDLIKEFHKLVRKDCR